MKNESKRQRKCKVSFWRVAITSYECSCVCPFQHNCVRTLTGVYVSWCFPAVFHHQTISHSKQLQKPSSPSPPIISSALLPPDHQNLPITRQRSTIKTYVYTTVSFMDQHVEKGGKSRNRSTVSTVSSSKLPWSASSRVFLFLELDTLHS